MHSGHPQAEAKLNVPPLIVFRRSLPRHVFSLLNIGH